MHCLNMLSLTHNFACTLRHTFLRIVTKVVAELVTLCMGDQSILSRFTNDNRTHAHCERHLNNIQTDPNNDREMKRFVDLAKGTSSQFTMREVHGLQLAYRVLEDGHM